MKGVLTLVCRMLGQVSDVLAEKLSASEKAEEPAKAGSGQQRAAGSTPLQDIFTVGQLVRCSIVALHDKDSSLHVFQEFFDSNQVLLHSGSSCHGSRFG